MDIDTECNKSASCVGAIAEAKMRGKASRERARNPWIWNEEDSVKGSSGKTTLELAPTSPPESLLPHARFLSSGSSHMTQCQFSARIKLWPFGYGTNAGFS